MDISTFDIRSRFLHFFTKNGHTHVPSSPVIPHDDPTLLFTNAGMNQFKDVFLGSSKREYTRATTSQKCIRAGGKHNDLENVGHTSRHLTFFEMIGNFSFGDYFKKEAIAFAWEVATAVFQFPEEKIYPTIFKDDDESFELWRKYVPESRITRFGEKDNFWAMGDTGPCGPCSELLFDRGPQYGKGSCPAEDPTGERFLEFWNLVFMQYNTLQNGQRELLPRPSIDTGAGLERVVSLVQGKNSVFETDQFMTLIGAIENVSKVRYDLQAVTAPAFRVIADHLRSLSFAIADGAKPSNTDRGYVLRKILRRAVRYGRQLGFDQPFLADLLPSLVDVMGNPYKELISASNKIGEILTTEEEAFLRTLRRGGNMLSKVVDEAVEKKKSISGDAAFLLKDTYGLPLEEIQLIAKDNYLELDVDRFYQLEKEAKERSKAARKCEDQIATTSIFEPLFHKYGATSCIHAKVPNTAVKIIGIVSCGKEVSSLAEGEEGCLLLDMSPFYAEKGGQVGDVGVLQHTKGYFQVDETQSVYGDLLGHKGIVRFGTMRVGDTVFATVDYERRKKIEANHTATHLLQYALQRVLGEHIRQSGSLVESGYLRFDFAHHKAMTKEELDQVELFVNQCIRENHSVVSEQMALEDAQRLPDVKQFFGEKYGSVVRVLTVGPSKEFCGGCHVSKTGEIGYFRIVKESSIAAGIRRIEALTGEAAVKEAQMTESLLDQIADFVKSAKSTILDKIQALFEDVKIAHHEIKFLQKEKIGLLCKGLSREQIGEKSFVYGVFSISAEGIKQAVEILTEKEPQSIIVLGSLFENRAYLSVKIPKVFVSDRLHAGTLLKKGLLLLQGNGGGKAEFAQGSGTDCAKIHEAVAAIIQEIQAESC